MEVITFGINSLIFLDGTTMPLESSQKTQSARHEFYLFIHVFREIPGVCVDWASFVLPSHRNFPSYHRLQFGILHLVLELFYYIFPLSWAPDYRD